MKMKNMKSREETKSVSRLNYFQNIKKCVIRRRELKYFQKLIDNELKDMSAERLAKQKNQGKDLRSFIPKDREVHIQAPKRKTKKSRRFSFLDEDIGVNE